MQRALYDPADGYYERADVPIGKAGDFLTNVSVGPLYGRLLAWRFATWIDALGEGRLQIVEAGAHDGRLAADVLVWLARWRPALAARLEYVAIEPSHVRRERQRRALAPFAAQLRWVADWSELGNEGVRGVVFSNELLDAFPVHRVGWDAGRKTWFEWGVGAVDAAFVWVRLPANADADANFWPRVPDALLEVLPDGFTTETCPAAKAWWRAAAQGLKAGKLMTVDYGLTALEFFAPHRAGGTLRAYRRHQLVSNVLEVPGEQDITASVDFDALRRAGEQEGLVTATQQNQTQFLAGILEELQHAGEASLVVGPAESRQFQTLVHPNHLGRAFRVLVQARSPK
jgi:SAM-dependent MidA family methyltransferase